MHRRGSERPGFLLVRGNERLPVLPRVLLKCDAVLALAVARKHGPQVDIARQISTLPGRYNLQPPLYNISTVLDSRRVTSVKAQSVRVAIRAALAGILIFSVAAILITPNLSDDVDGVLHQHHLRVLYLFFLSAILLHDLLVAWQGCVAGVNPRKPHTADLFDLFCSHLC
jgi:hypothetical protein